MKKSLICVIFLLTCEIGVSQQDLTLYNIHAIPQLRYTNPAFSPACKFHIGLPVISSIYLNLNHNGFVFADLVEKRAFDSIYINMDNVINKLEETNYLSAAAQVDLLSFGFKVKANYFFFNITEKVFIRFSYPKDLVKLFWKGNAVFIGETADFSGIDINATHYREHGLGMSRDLNEKLTIGGKLKYLYGMENISSEISELSLYTAPNTYELTGKADLLINASGSFTDSLVAFETGDLLYKNKNNGFAIDLGAAYKLNDKFSFSASLIDLGYIKWKTNVKNYTTEDASFTFKGVDLNTFIGSSETDPFGTIIDSLKSAYEVQESSSEYKDGLTPRVYLGGAYKLNENNNIGLLLQGEIFRKSLYPSLTVSFNNQVGRWLSSSLSYSILNRSYNNIGLGLSLNLGFFQIYVVSDNLLYLFNLVRVNNIILPYKAKNVHLRTGINLTFGRKEKDRDKDGIIDKKDECPQIAGPKEFNGCPDSDGDLIVDIHDDCPDDPGLPEYKGCPDRDGDKVIDKEDICPDTFGKIENKGCPVKLYLLDYLGDTLMTAALNDEGFFVFEKLPDQKEFIFELNAENTELIDEVQIMNKNKEGMEEIITAVKDPSDGYFKFFVFEVLPYEEDKLYLINEEGDTLMIALRNKEGFFVFENLPADQSYLFLLDTKDTELTDELLILLIDEKGEETVIAATKEEANRFKYEYIPRFDESKLTLVEEVDVPVILEEEEKKILKTAFDNLEFNSGSDVIRFKSYTYLEELSKLLLIKPQWHIKLSGHTDNIGDEKANLLLSKRRVEAVKRAIAKSGVSPDRIITRYHGETRPIADNSTEEGKQKNRRVEMLIIQGHIEDFDLESQPGMEEMPTDIMKESVQGIVYKIQILASKQPTYLTPVNFKGVENVEEYYHKGLYKYTAGESTDYGYANTVLVTQMRKKGFKEAFVVAFQDGERISVKKALKMLEK
ncbi:MAG: DUF5723 family protein [Bacteroidota bacterium]